jgi:hypothetical protein
VSVVLVMLGSLGYGATSSPGTKNGRLREAAADEVMREGDSRR